MKRQFRIKKFLQNCNYVVVAVVVVSVAVVTAKTQHYDG